MDNGIWNAANVRDIFQAVYQMQQLGVQHKEALSVEQCLLVLILLELQSINTTT